MDNIVKTLKAMFVPGSVSPIPKGLPTVNGLHRVLLGLQSLGKLECECDSLEYFDESLNESQQSAVTFALNSPEVACIWGPPGAI
jgi:DNA polymerase alpha-associated DNA helicase A